MDDLRELIMCATCVYKEGYPEFREVWNEVQPIAWFNQDEEEED